MSRRSPLQELPLDQFLPPNPNLSRKRPLPSPALFSPAKRRILNEEGIFLHKAQGIPDRFTQVLIGPASPAKKLDFGPQRNATSSKLPSSPANTQSQEMEDYFSQPSSSSSLPPPSSITSVVPPPSPDPQSIHYPGFRVYSDVHGSSLSLEELPHPLAPSGTKEKDGIKENIPPRRKSRKMTETDFPTSPSKAERPSKTPPVPAVSAEAMSDLLASPTPRRSTASAMREASLSNPRFTEKRKKT